MKRYTLATFLTLLVMAPAAKAQTLTEFITAMDAAGPVDVAGFKALLKTDRVCDSSPPIADTRCSYDGFAFDDAQTTGIIFLGRGAGGFLRILGISGACLSVADLEAKFGPGKIESHCMDGECLAWGANRAWGSIEAQLSQKNQYRCVYELDLEWR